MEFGVWEAFWAPQVGLERNPRSQHIQSYMQLKTGLIRKCQRQLATRFA